LHYVVSDKCVAEVIADYGYRNTTFNLI